MNNAETTDTATLPSVTFLDRPWVRATLLALVSGAVSLAVTSATLTWQGRDYLDAREERLLRQLRDQDLTHYVTKDTYNEARYQDAERLNGKLEQILDKIRGHR